MKTRLSSLIFVVLSCSVIPLAGQSFNKGDKDLNFTVGLGSPWVYWKGYNTVLPTIAMSFDYGFRDDLGPGVIGIGGIAGVTTYRDVVRNNFWLYEYGWKSTSLIGALRGTYHYQLLKGLDTYGGVHIGLRIESWRVYGDAPSNITSGRQEFHPVFNVFAGGKYHFSENLFVLGEVGLGLAFINVGFGLRL